MLRSDLWRVDARVDTEAENDLLIYPRAMPLSFEKGVFDDSVRQKWVLGCDIRYSLISANSEPIRIKQNNAKI